MEARGRKMKKLKEVNWDRSLKLESNRNFEYDDLDPIAIIGEENEGVGGIS
jgi:hypothetical protein